MKIAASILFIITGILLFQVGHNLIDQIERNKPSSITQEEFWKTEINDFDFTPAYFFKSIPELTDYPMDGILYFRNTNNTFRDNKMIIQSEIIQNSKTLFKNRFIFDISQKAELISIITEETLTGEINKIDNKDELKSLMLMYKGFIDLWLLHDAQ